MYVSLEPKNIQFNKKYNKDINTNPHILKPGIVEFSACLPKKGIN